MSFKIISKVITSDECFDEEVDRNRKKIRTNANGTNQKKLSPDNKGDNQCDGGWNMLKKG